jgi:hypothetical protein
MMNYRIGFAFGIMHHASFQHKVALLPAFATKDWRAATAYKRMIVTHVHNQKSL